jgi:hypothetical protein
MKKWPIVVLSASLLLYPFAVSFAQDSLPQITQVQDAPPVAQTLIREGDFAIKLAAELSLGNPINEAAAEDMLVNAGVSPLNGWISDYPVTPEIIGQLGDSISAAVSAGKLSISSEEAQKVLYSLSGQMNLPTPAGPEPGTIPQGISDATIVNNYYYDQGPPIITYYPPPPDYVYLYVWVPYPVIWSGFWFPGFYICNSFTAPVRPWSAGFAASSVIVSNHIFDPHTGAVTVVDPVVRTSTGTVQPETVLRTGSGQLYRTVTDMRHGAALRGVQSVRTRNLGDGRTLSTGGSRIIEVRKGAQGIYTRSMQGTSVQRAPERSMIYGNKMTHNAVPGVAGRSFYMPSRGSEGRSTAGSSPRSFYNRPVTTYGGAYKRGYVAPTAPQRSYGGTIVRGRPTTRPGQGGGTGWRGNGRM